MVISRDLKILERPTLIFKSVMWRIICWSLEGCWTGKNPYNFPNGDPVPGGKGGEQLCGGYFFVVWDVKGDLDYYQKDPRGDVVMVHVPAVCYL